MDCTCVYDGDPFHHRVFYIDLLSKRGYLATLIDINPYFQSKRGYVILFFML